MQSQTKQEGSRYVKWVSLKKTYRTMYRFFSHKLWSHPRDSQDANIQSIFFKVILEISIWKTI